MLFCGDTPARAHIYSDPTSCARGSSILSFAAPQIFDNCISTKWRLPMANQPPAPKRRFTRTTPCPSSEHCNNSSTGRRILGMAGPIHRTRFGPQNASLQNEPNPTIGQLPPVTTAKPTELATSSHNPCPRRAAPDFGAVQPRIDTQSPRGFALWLDHSPPRINGYCFTFDLVG
jgi:hypothetical protein